MAERIFSAGEPIFREGDESNEAYIIKSGHVEIIKEFQQGNILIAQLEPGEIFGEMGIVDERPRSLTAVAIDNVSLTSVTRDEFVDFLFQNPKEGIKYIQALFERLRAMNTRILPEDNTYLLDIEPPKKDKIIFLPLSKESSNSVPSGGIPIYKFPFRVGRISMRDEPNPLDLNDLYLTDSIPFNVSRNHFSIEHINNNFVIRDRGSYHGTVVNGDQIGGSIVMNDAQLKHGENEIIVGSINSPFRFRIVVQS